MILFNYTILRDTKDVLVITARGAGAETIPFLKTWVNLPLAFAFMVGYTKLSERYSNEALFNGIVATFLGFFVLFAYVLYPNQAVLHPHGAIDTLTSTLGSQFAPLLSIVRNWSFSMFYVMAELWGSVTVSVLFWGLANRIMTVPEAKKYYPLFGLIANVALVVSGRVVKYCSILRSNLPVGVDGWGHSVQMMTNLIALSGLFILFFNRQVGSLGLEKPPTKVEKPPKSVKKSLSILFESAYIRNLAMLVIAYGISINLVEVTWKSKLKLLYPNPNEYSAFMGDFSTITGMTTFCLMLLSRVVFQVFGWKVASLITPISLLVTGVAFYGCVIFGDSLAPLLQTFHTTPLALAVLLGAAQNILSKGSKYSLFDPCKEMAYIPLDDESKTNAKVAIDTVCNPLGKSGGSIIQQGLLMTYGSIEMISPQLCMIMAIVVMGWIRSSLYLGHQFEKMDN